MGGATADDSIRATSQVGAGRTLGRLRGRRSFLTEVSGGKAVLTVASGVCLPWSEQRHWSALVRGQRMAGRASPQNSAAVKSILAVGGGVGGSRAHTTVPLWISAKAANKSIERLLAKCTSGWDLPRQRKTVNEELLFTLETPLDSPGPKRPRTNGLPCQQLCPSKRHSRES